MQDQIKNQFAIGQGAQNRLTDNLYNSNAQFGGNYDAGVGMNLGSYNEIMSGYRNAMGGLGAGGGSGGAGGNIGDNSYGGYQDLAAGGKFGWDPLFRGAMSDAIGGYGEFAKTGGFSDQNIQDIRARGVAPLRATYANAQDNLARSRSLSGGAPNYAAAQAKMARELGYGLSDQYQNVNADIAQMVQQGRLAGLGGLTNAGSAGQGLSTNIDQLNLQGMLAGLGGMVDIDQARAAAARASGSAGAAATLQALRGMTDLYGTNPALANVFGNQLLGSEQNLLNNQQLQLGLGQNILQGQLGGSQIPGNFSSAMQNVNSVLAPVGSMIGAFGGGFGGLIPGGGGGGLVPSGNYGMPAPSDYAGVDLRQQLPSGIYNPNIPRREIYR